MHIIDQTRRKRDFESIINFIGHCFGGCCAPGADINQLMSHRCGHKLDYTGEQEVISAHYERLDRLASRLGTEFVEKEVERYQNFSSFGKSLSHGARKGYEEAVLKPPPNHWRWDQINFAFNETGLEPPPSIEEKKPEEGKKEPVQKRGRAEQKGAVDWREWFARYGKKSKLPV